MRKASRSVLQVVNISFLLCYFEKSVNFSSSIRSEHCPETTWHMLTCGHQRRRQRGQTWNSKSIALSHNTTKSSWETSQRATRCSAGKGGRRTHIGTWPARHARRSGHGQADIASYAMETQRAPPSYDLRTSRKRIRRPKPARRVRTSAPASCACSVLLARTPCAVN
jgi:hypothetical protein